MGRSERGRGLVLRLAVSGDGGVGIAFLYVAPVSLAGWWFGRRVGLAVALTCLGLYILGIAVHPVALPVASTVVRGAVLVAAALLAAELASRTRRLTQTAGELDAIRQALTPSAIPALPGLDVAVQFTPAEHGVSGDFYLLTNGPHGTNVAIVGDVCGHGPVAAQRATFARATLASVAASSDDPVEILKLVNDVLTDRWNDGNFLTATCIVHDPRAQSARIANAGHPPPIRLSDLSKINGGGPALGIILRAQFTSRRVALVPPEGLLVYTDGLLDARAIRGELYGEQRLIEELSRCAARPVGEIVESLSQSVSRFAGRALPDDVCIMALRSTPLDAPRSLP